MNNFASFALIESVTSEIMKKTEETLCTRVSSSTKEFIPENIRESSNRFTDEHKKTFAAQW